MTQAHVLTASLCMASPVHADVWRGTTQPPDVFQISFGRHVKFFHFTNIPYTEKPDFKSDS